MKTKSKKNSSKTKAVAGSSISKPVTRGKERQYNSQQLYDALDALGKDVSFREAAVHFDIPKSTLHDKKHNRTPVECPKGSHTELTREEEVDVANWIINRAETGFPVSKDHLLDCVQKYVTAMNRKFTKINAYLKKKNLLEISGERVFNLDETAFQLVPKDNHVLAKKGAKSVYKIVSSDEKASLTVLFVAAANGTLLTPMIFFDCKTTPRQTTLSKILKEWGVGHSESGWMTAETFYHYVKNCFIPWLQKNSIELPVVLYVDGHVSHLSYPLMQLCVANQIELITLYPNSTHIIQPLDVARFHQLKDKYRETLRKWRFDNDVVDYKKHSFAPVLELTLLNIDVTSSITNGFRTTGLFPLDADAVDYDVLNKNKKKIIECLPAIPNQKNENLEFYEKSILAPTVLDQFKKHILEESWSGDPDLTNNFIMWKKLLNSSTPINSGMVDNSSSKNVITTTTDETTSQNGSIILSQHESSDGILPLPEVFTQEESTAVNGVIEIEIVDEFCTANETESTVNQQVFTLTPNVETSLSLSLCEENTENILESTIENNNNEIISEVVTLKYTSPLQKVYSSPSQKNYISCSTVQENIHCAEYFESLNRDVNKAKSGPIDDNDIHAEVDITTSTLDNNSQLFKDDSSENSRSLDDKRLESTLFNADLFIDDILDLSNNSKSKEERSLQFIAANDNAVDKTAAFESFFKTPEFKGKRTIAKNGPRCAPASTVEDIMKSGALKENKYDYDKQLKLLNIRLDEVTELVAEERLKAVKTRIKIKQEKV
uniref:DDE-1 domain-containing protein n=1 Tax=Trichogramma kaykai TaxID=54128 RepID=A0ABD2WS72_9HYME